MEGVMNFLFSSIETISWDPTASSYYILLPTHTFLSSIRKGTVGPPFYFFILFYFNFILFFA